MTEGEQLEAHDEAVERPASVSAETAARMLGVSVRTITRHCRSNRIRGAFQFTYAGTWRIPVEEVQRMREGSHDS